MATARDPAAVLQHALLTRLKLRQLALLQAVDRHRTLGRVAAEMRLSQPAITKALHEVEDIFDAPLFERTSRGLLPTPAGDAVLEYARRWLAELEATAQVLTSIGSGRSGRLRLGLTQWVPQQLLSTALTHLLQGTPRTAVMTREGVTDELVAALMAGELDCAIGRSYDGPVTGVVQQAFYEQEPCLMVAAASVKRLSRGPLDWARLAQLDWILPPPNTPMRRTYNAVFVGAGVQPPQPLLETTSMRSIETVLRTEANAVCILARDVVAEMAQGGVVAALPYRLGWMLPPVSFFTLKQLEQQPAVVSLRAAVMQTARQMQAKARAAA
ncbi:LysR family transcriptional regulator [Ramlibacter sp. G-1-2-2]|uniref:LysR family transcriptional regulator n=1 Tax=Ramlibacter agri TaxID=2728837 RepID=A0A848HC10_9BURK|nr:LysR family transcriptional regulator [Ramlibacter agri]NML47029.1 LysR family transcriptional regulator [Ramlibacter agri]